MVPGEAFMPHFVVLSVLVRGPNEDKGGVCGLENVSEQGALFSNNGKLLHLRQIICLETQWA